MLTYATATRRAATCCVFSQPVGGGIKYKDRQSVSWSLAESRLAVQLFSCRRRWPLPPARIHALISVILLLADWRILHLRDAQSATVAAAAALC